MDLNTKFINTYLDAPIIRNERDAFLKILLDLSYNIKVDVRSSTKRKAESMLKEIDGDSFSALDPDRYPSLDAELSPTDRSHEMQSAGRMGKMVFDQASRGARDMGSPAGLGVDFAEMSTIPHIAKEWYSKMRLFEEIVQIVATSKALGNNGMCQCRSGNVFYLGDEHFGVIKMDHISEWYLVTFTQLLMFKDMYYGRFNAIAAAWQIYRSPQLIQSIVDCLEWFFKCIAVYNNKGYELGKGIEPLSKASLILKTDSILGPNGSYDTLLEDMIKKEREWGKQGDFLSVELDEILRKNLTLPESVEIFGLQKLSGHPLIDPCVGGRSVREEAKRKINYKMSDVQRVRNNCCRIYLEGFIRKEHRWPGLSFDRRAKRSKLYQLYSLEERNINRSSYPLDDWTGVRFEKHHEFDYYPNFTDLMDDKSISFYRDEAAATWNSRMTPRSHKRLLMEMLKRPNVSIYEIVERVRRGDIPFSWFIVTLYPKEREFKIAARMFSMMVFEMRAFFTATEANMAEKVFPYLPQQTMTLTGQEIQELFHKITDTPNSEDLERLFLEIDFKRWNLRWHPEVVDPVGQDLDDMFGLPGVFTAIHHFFEKCMILVRVPVCKPKGVDLPDPPESDLLFYNHEVGFEGIGQKPWTFLTYGMVDLGIGELTHRYYLIGSADNQIVLMSVDCTGALDRVSHVRDLSERIRAGIYRESEKVGQEAKPEECLASTSVITYGKKVHINGVEYFTSVKAHSRIFPHNSSDFPSIDGSIGAISGQCLSAAEQMKEPMHSFALWCFHASLYLYRIRETVFVETSQLSYNFRETLTDRVIYGSLILPGDLGGTQIAPVTSFFYKGGADPLSKSYSSLKFYQSSSGLCRKFIHALSTSEWFDHSVDLDTLIDDPYGLPLSRPSTAENSIYTASKSKVNGVSRNHAIRELTAANIEKYEKDLRTALKSARPFNPVLLSDILGWSVVGAKETISRMFTSTRTIQALLQGDKSISVCSRILSTGTGHFLNTIMRISQTMTGERRIESVYSDVKTMRSHWGKTSGVDIAGVTSYVPFDMPWKVGAEPDTRPGFKSMALPITGGFPFHERGPEEPYVGRATQEKRSEHGYKIVTSSAPERAVKRLADIATQPGVSLSFKNLISKVARSRALVDLSSVYPVIGNAIGGSISHRYASRLGLRSANGLGTVSFASKCFLVNDDARPISGGEHDIPVMVQEQMVAGIALLGINRRQFSSSIYCTIFTDTIDWEILPDDVVDVTDPRDLESPFLSGNILATVDHILLERTHGPYSTPFISPLPDVFSKRYSPIYALRRLIGRALEGSHSASAIADVGAGTLRFSMDLLELRGIGLEETARSAAREIALTAVEAIFSKSRSELRWTPAPMVTTLSEAFSRSVIGYYLHPSFREDPFVVDTLRPSSLKYQFSGSNPMRRLRDYIAREGLSLFRVPSSLIYTDKEIIFADDKSGTSSRVIVRRFKAILLQGVLSGQCPMETAVNILRVQIPKSLRSEPTEEGRLASFYRMCVTLADWAQGVGLLFLAEQFVSLYGGHRIHICGIPAAEVIRLSRSEILYERQCLETGAFPGQVIDPLSVCARRSSALGAPSPFSLLNDVSGIHERQRQDFEIHRLAGRVHGHDSSAGYSYVPLVPLSSGRVCVVIGCGYGSGPALLLKGGAAMVFGLDLWSDCEERCTILPMAPPPAILHTKTSRLFVRIPTRPEETGNITSPATAGLVNRHSGEGSLYVIDVPIRTPEDMINTLNTCSLLRGTSQVLIRLLTRVHALQQAYCCLEESGLSPSVYGVCSDGVMIEAWVEIRVPQVFILKGCISTCDIDVSGCPEEYPDLSILGGGTRDLLRVIEGPYEGLSTQSLEAGVLSLGDTMLMSVGDLVHRFTYKQWTEVIHILVAREVIDSGDRRARIRDIIRNDIITVRIGDHVVPVQVNSSLRLLLTKTVSRLGELPL